MLSESRFLVSVAATMRWHSMAECFNLDSPTYISGDKTSQIDMVWANPLAKLLTSGMELGETPVIGRHVCVGYHMNIAPESMRYWKLEKPERLDITAIRALGQDDPHPNGQRWDQLVSSGDVDDIWEAWQRDVVTAVTRVAVPEKQLQQQIQRHLACRSEGKGAWKEVKFAGKVMGEAQSTRVRKLRQRVMHLRHLRRIGHEHCGSRQALSSRLSATSSSGAAR